MKKLLLCFIISTCLIGCNKENSNNKSETVTNSNNNIKTNTTNNVAQGDWSADCINSKTGTIFNEAGDTRYLKVADLNSKFSKDPKSIYFKIDSPNGDNHILWTSKSMETKIPSIFIKWKQELAKNNKNTKLLQEVENTLPNTTVIDLIMETNGNKLINQAIRFGFFSDEQFEKIDAITINVNGKDFILKNPGLEKHAFQITKPHFFNIVITPISPELIKELAKVKANGDIAFTVKANGMEKKYLYKNVMEENDGIYPLLMKANQCMK